VPTRRDVLSLTAGGTIALAGCGQTDDSDDTEFGLGATDAVGRPGEVVPIEVLAWAVGELTYTFELLPDTWQVTQGDFDPMPTAVRESYPPELVWNPAVDTVSGAFLVAIPAGTKPGEYSLSVEARAGDSPNRTTTTAVVAVREPTGSGPSEN